MIYVIECMYVKIAKSRPSWPTNSSDECRGAVGAKSIRRPDLRECFDSHEDKLARSFSIVSELFVENDCRFDSHSGRGSTWSERLMPPAPAFVLKT